MRTIFAFAIAAVLLSVAMNRVIRNEFIIGALNSQTGKVLA